MKKRLRTAALESRSGVGSLLLLGGNFLKITCGPALFKKVFNGQTIQ